MPTNIIIDLETVSTAGDAGILAIAMTAYSEADVDKTLDELVVENSILIKLDIKDQLANYGRHINKDTMDWWKKQGDEAKKILKPQSTDIKVSQLEDIIEDFCRKHNYDGNGFIWQRGNVDIVWLDSLFEALNSHNPLKWWKVRDIRTAIDIKCGSSKGYVPNYFNDFDKEFPNFTAHDPTHDIMRDIFQLRLIGVL